MPHSPLLQSMRSPRSSAATTVRGPVTQCSSTPLLTIPLAPGSGLCRCEVSGRRNLGPNRFTFRVGGDKTERGFQERSNSDDQDQAHSRFGTLPREVVGDRSHKLDGLRYETHRTSAPPSGASLGRLLGRCAWGRAQSCKCRRLLPRQLPQRRQWLSSSCGRLQRLRVLSGSRRARGSGLYTQQSALRFRQRELWVLRDRRCRVPRKSTQCDLSDFSSRHGHARRLCVPVVVCRKRNFGSGHREHNRLLPLR